MSRWYHYELGINKSTWVLFFIILKNTVLAGKHTHTNTHPVLTFVLLTQDINPSLMEKRNNFS